MEARMKNPMFAVPGAMEIAKTMGTVLHGVETSIDLELVSLRASQINGCAVCLDMHSKALRKNGESDDKLHAVAAWRESPLFTDAERAALALTEAGTRIADRGEAVPDDVWEAAADHFSEEELGTIVLQIAAINFYNRINAVTKQIPAA
jgi:AhpD family alkylhydroperoxidase